jgi:ubiquinone/menaquinone biosynthesis C-methylase UbiE
MPAGDGDAMGAEFDTVPAWTVEAVEALGESYAVPGACRGSGTPSLLQWLLDGLGPASGERLLDVGAGMGGPAAFARAATGVRPVLVDPSAAACDAARRLFGADALRAVGERLPFADRSFRSVWCLGTVCTTPHHDQLAGELARVLRTGGRVGLLVLVRKEHASFTPPAGNHFPTRTRLEQLLARSGLRALAVRESSTLPDAPQAWRRAAEAVAERVEAQHGREPAHLAARRQEDRLGQLLASRCVSGLAVVAVRR